MKREQIINKIYDKIRDDLLHASLLYWEEDDGNKYPLVDHLSSGDDISTGRDEIDNLIEQIEIEPLMDAILALPLKVQSGDIQTTAYNEALEKYLKEGINWSSTANDVINCDRGNVEQLAADSFFEGAIWMRNEIIKRNRVI